MYHCQPTDLFQRTYVLICLAGASVNPQSAVGCGFGSSASSQTLVALRNSELYGHQHQPLLRKMLLHRGWLFRVCGVIVDPMHASSFQSSGLFHEVPFELVEVVRERSLGTRLDCGGPGCTWGTLQCSSNMSFGCAAACPSWAASVDGLGFRFPSNALSCPMQG